MPGDPSSCCIRRLSSWLSQFRTRVSSSFIPASLVSSHQYSRLPNNSIDGPTHCADVDVSPPPATHHASVSGVSEDFTAESISARPLPCLSPSPPASLLRLDPPLFAPGEEQLEVPNNHANPELSPMSSPHHTSILKLSVAPPCPPQLLPGQASTYQGPSHIFSEAHNFTVKDSTFIQSNTTTDNFMKELLQETIIGAEFDSSARDPPPRCHPGTRLAIIQRCLDFIVQCLDEGKLRWVVGPAGVGKSAIMQMVTESAPDDIIFASVFLSVNGRSDGSKTILTIAYQLAVKCGPYRQFIRDQITLDPSLLKKSLSVQFNKFIVEPFMFGRLFNPSQRFLVIIDGLDECNDRLIQRKLLELITNFCITHPTSPIAWIVASRPEPHITLFFDKAEVKQVYTKEEVGIDSDEACEEVQRYLRDELKKIKTEHPTLKHKREWPLEHEFTKIASAAGGLFAYAATVIRFIGDPTHGGPAAQLRRVIELADAGLKDDATGRNHPMDQLDALYRRILSNVPDNVMPNIRKLLILRSHNRFKYLGFRTQCNALGLTEEDAYDAICHLQAVMKIPEPDKADSSLSYYHKSFDDFLRDFDRSGFSRNFSLEGHDLDNSTSLRIIDDLQDDGGAHSEDIRVDSYGILKGSWDNISLSWPGDERFQLTDEGIRITLFKEAIQQVYLALPNLGDLRQSASYFHALTTCLAIPLYCFPFDNLLTSTFEQFRDEVAKLGKLKQAPLRTFEYTAIVGNVELRFTSPTGHNFRVSDPWNPSCEHYKNSVDDLDQRRGWSTKFKRCRTVDTVAENDEDTDIPRFRIATYQQQHEKWAEVDNNGNFPSACFPCTRRFAHRFMNNQDLLATYFVDGTQMCYVEVIFVDPDDRVSEWRYRFLHSGRPSSLDV